MSALRPGACAALLCWLAAAAPQAQAQDASWQVAFFNIQSGKGVAPLGRRAPFANTHNCSDSSLPMNGWPLVEAELRGQLADRRVIALGLAEAWRCGSPERVRSALGWEAHTGEKNGTALLARYGFAAEPQWVQLDTSRNTNPKDTMWVVRAPVCTDAPCTQSIPVYVTHWYGTGAQAAHVYLQQSAATVRFMSQDRGPHVLVGDLNVFEGRGEICGQRPNNVALAPLRRAGYVDVWPAVHGDREGYTGMINRRGCGSPEGYPWKRVDYVWVRGFRPTAMSRFAMPPAGEAAPSDHVGILATFGADSSSSR